MDRIFIILLEMFKTEILILMKLYEDDSLKQGCLLPGTQGRLSAFIPCCQTVPFIPEVSSGLFGF